MLVVYVLIKAKYRGKKSLVGPSVHGMWATSPISIVPSFSYFPLTGITCWHHFWIQAQSISRREEGRLDIWCLTSRVAAEVGKGTTGKVGGEVGELLSHISNLAYPTGPLTPSHDLSSTFFSPPLLSCHHNHWPYFFPPSPSQSTF